MAVSSAQVEPAVATRMMPIGDSITEARTASQGIPSYRAALWDQLQVAGANVDFVGSRHGVLDHFDRPSGMADPGGTWDKDHDGHYGWRTDEILNGKNAGDGKLSDWLTAHTPDVLIVHIGTNDLVQGQTVSTTIDDVRQLVLTARAQNP
ncbi:MAG: GDSL-type esterase/lipase family protein, partial [Actinomycetota bacterium]|nr:GDSL-type esterase/lipase family protein [Actinomycetota bacterium]